MSTLSHIVQEDAQVINMSIRSAQEPRSGVLGGREPARIVIADDHTMFREGVRALLQTDPGLEVVGEAADGVAVVRMVEKCRPDLLLLDMSMPRQDGMAVLQELSDSGLTLKVLIITASIDSRGMLRALKLGARGVLLKAETGGILLDSIHRVIEGGYWIGQEGVNSLVDLLRNLSEPTNHAADRFGVTAREMQIISTVVGGYSNQEIAQKFSISQQTVKHHLSHIFDKLGVYNRLELALFAINHHLIDSN